MGQHKKALIMGRLVVCIISFVGTVGFWTLGLTTGDKTALTMAGVYTVLTLWTFDRWYTLRRGKL